MPVSIAMLGIGAPPRGACAGAAVWAATLSGAATAAAPATAAPFSNPRRVTLDPRILAIGPSLVRAGLEYARWLMSRYLMPPGPPRQSPRISPRGRLSPKVGPSTFD